MSQSRSDSGQSMEEILASIRRIIAEGEREAQAAAEAGEDERAELPAATAAAAAPLPPAGESDVLVLTEMVQDDGSVVSLHSGTASAPGRSETEAEKAPELGTAPPQTVTEAALDTGAIEAPAAPAAVSPEPAAPAEPVQITAAPVTPEAVRDEWAALSVKTSIAEERIAVPAEGYKKTELVSEEALAASTAALSQLAQSVSRTREPTPGQTKTVEELVREAVEPMLKQWLDANLSRIVERMVREAIERVVRRVE
jgi:hypothetical protein